MSEIKKIGCIKVSGLTAETLELDEKELKKEEFYKFIQIKINQEDYIRIGDLYHRRILRETLKEFSLDFEEKENKECLIPLHAGKNYELVGAGRIRFLGPNLNFYDGSTDYMENVKGTNRNNLEKIFGKENDKNRWNLCVP